MMTAVQIEQLSRPLYRIITEFFNEQSNEERYQKWINEQSVSDGEEDSSLGSSRSESLEQECLQ